MASPVTIQPSTADNYLYEFSVTTNYGTATIAAIQPTTSKRMRSPISFDFSSVVPAGATITVATLSLYFYTVVGGRTLTVYRLLRADWSETQSSWNGYKTGASWTTAGALSDGDDFTSTDAATAASPASAAWVNWDVKNQVQAARDSVGGIAHFLVADVGATATAQNIFRTREYAVNTTLCPKLYIEYTVPSTVLPNFLPFFWA